MAFLIAIYIGIGIAVSLITNKARLKEYDAEMFMLSPFYWAWCSMCALIWPIDLIFFSIEKIKRHGNP